MILFDRHMLAALALVGGIAPAVIAQTPAKPAPARPAAAPQAPAAIALPGVSAEGNAALTRISHQDDAIARDAILKLRALAPQLTATANQQPLDVEKFGALLHQADSLQATIQSRKTERIVAGLRVLPAADRQPFLKAITARPTQVPAQ